MDSTKATLQIIFSVIKKIIIGFFIFFFSLIFIMAIDTYISTTSFKFRKIKIGQNEEQIIKYLGEPFKVHYIKDKNDLSYIVKGFGYKPFNKSGKILIYYDKWEILYILIIDGKVSDLYIGDA